MKCYPNFGMAIERTGLALRDVSTLIHTGRWQGIEIGSKPEMATYEILNHSFQVQMDESHRILELLAADVKPNIPWADDHFLERVGGEPLNPGVQWRNWPYAASADRFRTDEQFNHSYMERLWPKFAGQTPTGQINGWDLDDPNRGIRHEYGDLLDVARQLAFEPDTRQAFVPLFFPEDTGAVHKGRIPCTLGYHFIMRGGFLHIVYYLRSCDFVRHFRDDIYLAVRLLLWMLDQCRQLNPMAWDDVVPGLYTMHITSLHLFRNDYAATFGTERKLRR